MKLNTLLIILAIQLHAQVKCQELQSPQISCVIRIFYQSGLFFKLKETENQLHDAHYIGHSLTVTLFATPFPQHLPLDSYYETRGHLKYQLGCEFVVIYHLTPTKDIISLINLQSMRNARLWTSSELTKTSTFETESVNIVTVQGQSAGQFNFNPNLNAVVSKTPKSRGNPLRNRHIRVSFYELKPHYYHADGKTVGIAYEMVDAASKHYNFTYSVTLDPAIVTKDTDGKLRGMENEVIHGRIDMNFLYAPTFLPPGANVEASTYYSPASIVFLAQLPKRKTKWTAILYAFQLDSWLVTLGTCGAFMLVICIKLCQSGYNGNISISVFIVFNGLLGQEISKIPRPTRALTILWILTAFILRNYYCSNLLSLLTYPEMELVPKDMVDLALAEDYKVVGIELPGGSMEQYFNKSTSWELVNIWKRATFLPMVKCVTEAVTTPKQVCLGWDFMTEGFLQTNATINEFFYPAFKSRNPPITVLTCGVLQKNSPYTDGINEVVGWSRDSGLYYKWLYESERLTKLVGKSWLMSEGERSSKLTRQLVEGFRGNFDEGQAEPFKLINLRAPFIQLAVGCFLALVAFGGEMCVGILWTIWNTKRNALEARIRGYFSARRKMARQEIVLPFADVLKRFGYNNE